MHRLKVTYLASLVCASTVVFAADSVPTGWVKAGSHPSEYEVGVDSSVRHSGRGSGYVKATATTLHGFGTLMQTAGAGGYLGKRIRLSAFVKSENVASGWAGLWLRIDGAPQGQNQTPTVQGFDNMQRRPIKGTTDWTRADIVLDVPSEAIDLAFGILLAGDGEVWLDDVTFEVVPLSVPVTGTAARVNTSPSNLDFEK
jgi:hypothetical protein